MLSCTYLVFFISLLLSSVDQQSALNDLTDAPGPDRFVLDLPADDGDRESALDQLWRIYETHVRPMELSSQFDAMGRRALSEHPTVFTNDEKVESVLQTSVSQKCQQKLRVRKLEGKEVYTVIDLGSAEKALCDGLTETLVGMSDTVLLFLESTRLPYLRVVDKAIVSGSVFDFAVVLADAEQIDPAAYGDLYGYLAWQLASLMIDPKQPRVFIETDEDLLKSSVQRHINSVVQMGLERKIGIVRQRITELDQHISRLQDLNSAYKSKHEKVLSKILSKSESVSYQTFLKQYGVAKLDGLVSSLESTKLSRVLDLLDNLMQIISATRGEAKRFGPVRYEELEPGQRPGDIKINLFGSIYEKIAEHVKPFIENTLTSENSMAKKLIDKVEDMAEDGQRLLRKAKAKVEDAYHSVVGEDATADKPRKALRPKPLPRRPGCVGLDCRHGERLKLGKQEGGKSMLIKGAGAKLQQKQTRRLKKNADAEVQEEEVKVEVATRPCRFRKDCTDEEREAEKKSEDTPAKPATESNDIPPGRPCRFRKSCREEDHEREAQKTVEKKEEKIEKTPALPVNRPCRFRKDCGEEAKFNGDSKAADYEKTQPPTAKTPIPETRPCRFRKSCNEKEKAETKSVKPDQGVSDNKGNLKRETGRDYSPKPPSQASQIPATRPCRFRKSCDEPTKPEASPTTDVPAAKYVKPPIPETRPCRFRKNCQKDTRPDERVNLKKIQDEKVNAKSKKENIRGEDERQQHEEVKAAAPQGRPCRFRKDQTDCKDDRDTAKPASSNPIRDIPAAIPPTRPCRFRKSCTEEDRVSPSLPVDVRTSSATVAQPVPDTRPCRFRKSCNTKDENIKQKPVTEKAIKDDAKPVRTPTAVPGTRPCRFTKAGCSGTENKNKKKQQKVPNPKGTDSTSYLVQGSDTTAPPKHKMGNVAEVRSNKWRKTKEFTETEAKDPQSAENQEASKKKWRKVNKNVVDTEIEAPQSTEREEASRIRRLKQKMENDKLIAKEPEEMKEIVDEPIKYERRKGSKQASEQSKEQEKSQESINQEPVKYERRKGSKQASEQSKEQEKSQESINQEPVKYERRKGSKQASEQSKEQEKSQESINQEPVKYERRTGSKQTSEQSKEQAADAVKETAAEIDEDDVDVEEEVDEEEMSKGAGEVDHVDVQVAGAVEDALPERSRKSSETDDRKVSDRQEAQSRPDGIAPSVVSAKPTGRPCRFSKSCQEKEGFAKPDAKSESQKTSTEGRPAHKPSKDDAPAKQAASPIPEGRPCRFSKSCQKQEGFAKPDAKSGSQITSTEGRPAHKPSKDDTVAKQAASPIPEGRSCRFSKSCQEQEGFAKPDAKSGSQKTSTEGRPAHKPSKDDTVAKKAASPIPEGRPCRFSKSCQEKEGFAKPHAKSGSQKTSTEGRPAHKPSKDDTVAKLAASPIPEGRPCRFSKSCQKQEGFAKPDAKSGSQITSTEGRPAHKPSKDDTVAKQAASPIPEGRPCRFSKSCQEQEGFAKPDAKSGSQKTSTEGRPAHKPSKDDTVAKKAASPIPEGRPCRFSKSCHEKEGFAKPHAKSGSQKTSTEGRPAHKPSKDDAPAKQAASPIPEGRPCRFSKSCSQSIPKSKPTDDGPEAKQNDRSPSSDHAPSKDGFIARFFNSLRPKQNSTRFACNPFYVSCRKQLGLPPLREQRVVQMSAKPVRLKKCLKKRKKPVTVAKR